VKPLALALALLVVVACNKAPSTAVGAVDAGASAPAAVKLDPLCVSAFAPGKTSRIDEDLTLLIARVKALPSNPNTLVLLGRAWVQKARNAHDPGYYLHADACARQALAAKPHYAPAQHLRALAMLNGHRFAKARDLAREMIAADRDDAHAYGVLSDALLELGDIDAAVAASQRMMDLRPNLPSYARASYLLWLRGDEKGALESIRLAYDAGRGQPDREPAAWVLTEAAHIFRHRGDVEGALAGYEKALSELPDYPPALVGKARCLLALGGDRAKEAPALLDKVMAAEPSVDAAWLLGEAHLAAGRTAEADKAFADVKRIGAQSDLRGLALFLATTGGDVRAAQDAIAKDRATRGGIYSDDIEALLAWRSGDDAKAKMLIARANRFGTPDPKLRVHRALIERDDAMLAEAMKQGGNADVTLKRLVAR
jgi:tetratricopeptide (TPR) repeat protein